MSAQGFLVGLRAGSLKAHARGVGSDRSLCGARVIGSSGRFDPSSPSACKSCKLAAERLTSTDPIWVDGDRPGFYAAVCDECTGGDLGTQGCGETRYYKRDAKADAAAHREAHAAWGRGERTRAWPA